MEAPHYPMPAGVHAIPDEELDLRPDAEIEAELLHPDPESASTSDKNVWFFWDQGYEAMHAYTKRNVIAWHRRLARLGWTVRVVDLKPGSAGHVGRYLDVTDRATFPAAFANGRVSGPYAAQHYSDLVRWPLLLRYGGVYADVGLLQIGDLDRLWCETIARDDSPYEVLTYNMGGPRDYRPTNYFLAARRDNALFARCHRLFLALWARGGGRESTEGMHADPLLAGVPLLGDSKGMLGEEGQRELSDYITQGQVLTGVLGLVDEADGWDGPRYAAERVFAIDWVQGSQLCNEFTSWDGRLAFDLLSLRLPEAEGEQETEAQGRARALVEGCLSKSFAFKLAHGLIVKVMGDTLGSLWRKNPGSDDVPGTYAHWLRYATCYWCPDELPSPIQLERIEPYRKGPLLLE